MDAADLIWNRAALERGGTSPGAGDRVLADMLAFHGLVMSGGFLDATERTCTEDQARIGRGLPMVWPGDGRRLLVRCYDPDTGDVVALWPSDVSEDPGAPGHFVAASIPKRHHPDEYVPEDDPGSWPISGLCAELPTA